MNNDIVTRLCKIAFVNSVIGVCTVGIIPAFGIMGIAVGLVLKFKGVELDDENAQKIKYSYILGSVSLVCFAVDILLMWIFFESKIIT